MAASLNQVDDFARNFFLFIEQSGYRSVVLHGGDDGFTGNISDIDFAIEFSGFDRIAELAANFSQAHGWRLCQILRHETTSAFLVCSKSDDPSLVVALDACSDYQRSSRLLMPVAQLLGSRRRLTWGGYGLNQDIEAQYRFIKGVVKGKNPISVLREFERYPPETRLKVRQWIATQWQLGDSVQGDICDANIAQMMEHVLQVVRSRPRYRKFASAIRVLSRILNPTGLVVVVGERNLPVLAPTLCGVFGKLYFRNYHVSDGWHLPMNRMLLCSSLLVVAEINEFIFRCLPRDAVLRLSDGKTVDEHIQHICNHLAARCIKRERISSKRSEDTSGNN